MPTKILVVDDSATMRRVLEMTFAGEDAQVVTVDNGEAAVAKAAETSPDVVFADASMGGGVDGYEVARRIKANGGKAAVILMASQHHPYDDGKGRSAGVDDHISKPFDTQSVIDRVSQVLARPRAGAAAAAAPAPAAPKAAGTAPSMNAATAPGRTPLAGRTVMGVQPPIQPAPAPVARPAAPAPAPAPVLATPAARPVSPAASTTAPFAPMSAPPIAPPARPAPPAPAPAARPAATAAVTAAAGGMAAKLNGLGLSKEQVESILSLTREVVEQVVWEVVPDLAEQLIKEEIKRLTAD